MKPNIKLIANLAKVGMANGMTKEKAIDRAIEVYTALNNPTPNYLFQAMCKKGAVKKPEELPNDKKG